MQFIAIIKTITSNTNKHNYILPRTFWLLPDTFIVKMFGCDWCDYLKWSSYNQPKEYILWHFLACGNYWDKFSHSPRTALSHFAAD